MPEEACGKAAMKNAQGDDCNKHSHDGHDKKYIDEHKLTVLDIRRIPRTCHLPTSLTSAIGKRSKGKLVASVHEITAKATRELTYLENGFQK
jgi:hypothetical protein